MPRLPDLTALGERPAPQPRAGVPHFDVVSGAETAEGLAVARAGRVIEHEFARIAEQNDRTAAEDAYNKLLQQQLDLTKGEQNGFTNLRGEAAVKRPFMKEWQQKFDEAEKGIAGALGNPRQQELFRRRGRIARLQFGQDMLNHATRERESYAQEVYKGGLAVETEAAASRWTNPPAIAASLERINGLIRAEAARQGWAPELAEAERQARVSAVHEAVLTQAIAADSTLFAEQYYKANKDAMSARARAVIGDKIETSSAEVAAANAAESIWSAMGPKSDIDPVNVDVMAAAAREQFKDNPKVSKSVIADLKDRAVLHNAAQSERAFANEGAVWDALQSGQSMAALRKMPEFRALPGGKRVQVEDAILSRGRRLSAEAEAAQTERMEEAYWRYADAEVLSGMSENEVRSLYPALGRRFTQDLLNKHRQLTKPEALKEATVDDDMFKLIAHEAGLSPYDTGLSEKEKARLGRLKNMVETQISVEQQRRGKNLTRDEKGELMRGLVTEVQVRQPGLLWGENIKPRKLFEVEAPESIVISDDERASIILDFNRAGIKRYTESDIMNAYLRKKAP